MLAVLSETIDEIGKHRRLGGPAYYSSLTLLSLGAEFDALLTGNVMSEVLGHSGCSVRTFCDRPTKFRFISIEPRRLRVLDRCVGTISGLLHKDYEVALVSLTMGEVPLADLYKVAEHSRTLVIDVQGFVRDIDENDIVFNSEALATRLLQVAKDIQERGSNVLIKASREELPPSRLTDEFISLGGTLVITMGSESVKLLTGPGCWAVRPPETTGDSTGAGDVMLAALVNYLVSGRDIRHSLLMGVAAGSIRLAKKEPPWILWSEIESLARRLELVECGSIGDSPNV